MRLDPIFCADTETLVRDTDVDELVCYGWLRVPPHLPLTDDNSAMASLILLVCSFVGRVLPLSILDSEDSGIPDLAATSYCLIPFRTISTFSGDTRLHMITPLRSDNEGKSLQADEQHVSLLLQLYHPALVETVP